ncbi:MAG: cytochrome c, partial [Gammaproteobacteria bacterium]
IAAALLGTLALSAATVGVAQLFEPLDLSGEEMFMRYCAACHGTDARGTGPVARTMNKRVPDLTQLAISSRGEFPAQAVRDAIDGRAMAVSHGTRQMPVWGYEFWVEEGADVVAERTARQMINRIVAYLESIQASDEPRGFELEEGPRF